MFYFIKTPWFLRKLYPDCVWRMPTTEKKIYLSFDDGPHAVATPFVLDQLRRFGARATFFCIGKNVIAEPDLYKRVLEEGHRVGNHTQHHLNGWKTDDKTYLADIAEASRYIDSDLFRPPYGKSTKFQLMNLRKLWNYRIIMWDVLSADFDISFNGEKCAAHVLLHAQPGSIVVFHDSAKAFKNLEIALPLVLEALAGKGYSFEELK
jgi:peptidoglycan-N-acetylglucosamine deacetylase